MNVLIVGLGSIGKRHLQNLVRLGVENISIVRRNGQPFENYKVFGSIANAFENERFTHAIVATPTAIHFQTFKELVSFQISAIYLEKPIAGTVEEGKRILALSKANPMTKVYVGYDLRFDPGLQKVKEILESKIMGSPLSFQAEVGQYLPDWRPHEDYRKGMSASKMLGGGVMLDLVHEFDYLYWLLGSMRRVVGIHDKISTLEIETEDVSKVILQTQEGAIGTVSLDYLQKKLSRNCKIVCNDGVVCWDYVTSKVSWYVNNDSKWHTYEYVQFERNDRFIAIMKGFISTIKNDKEQMATLDQGMTSLKIVEAAKNSNTTQNIIAL